MPWEAEVVGGRNGIGGHVGDPLNLVLTIRLGKALDFGAEARWLFQVRESVLEATPTLEVSDIEATYDVDDEADTTTIAMLVTSSTSAIEAGRTYYAGLRCTAGPFADYTAIEALPLKGRLPVARVDPEEP